MSNARFSPWPPPFGPRLCTTDGCSRLVLFSSWTWAPSTPTEEKVCGRRRRPIAPPPSVKCEVGHWVLGSPPLMPCKIFLKSTEIRALHFTEPSQTQARGISTNELRVGYAKLVGVGGNSRKRFEVIGCCVPGSHSSHDIFTPSRAGPPPISTAASVCVFCFGRVWRSAAVAPCSTRSASCSQTETC